VFASVQKVHLLKSEPTVFDCPAMLQEQQRCMLQMTTKMVEVSCRHALGAPLRGGLARKSFVTLEQAVDRAFAYYWYQQQRGALEGVNTWAELIAYNDTSSWAARGRTLAGTVWPNITRTGNQCYLYVEEHFCLPILCGRCSLLVAPGFMVAPLVSRVAMNDEACARARAWGMGESGEEAESGEEEADGGMVYSDYDF